MEAGARNSVIIINIVGLSGKEFKTSVLKKLNKLENNTEKYCNIPIKMSKDKEVINASS